MAIFEVKSDVRTWLRNRRKDELIYIILANLDHINLFADAPDASRNRPPEFDRAEILRVLEPFAKHWARAGYPDSALRDPSDETKRLVCEMLEQPSA